MTSTAAVAASIYAAAPKDAAGSDNWLIYLLFIAAGFLVGGAWASWQARHVVLTIITGVLAAVVCGVAVTWLISEVS